MDEEKKTEGPHQKKGKDSFANSLTHLDSRFRKIIRY